MCNADSKLSAGQKDTRMRHIADSIRHVVKVKPTPRFRSRHNIMENRSHMNTPLHGWKRWIEHEPRQRAGAQRWDDV